MLASMYRRTADAITGWIDGAPLSWKPILVLSLRHSITRGCAIPCENVHNTMVWVLGGDGRRLRETYCTLDDILQVLDCLATRAELISRRRASHAFADKPFEELREGFARCPRR
jgi:hypothetical protein